MGPSADDLEPPRPGDRPAAGSGARGAGSEREELVEGGTSSEVLARLAGREPPTERYQLRGEVAQGGMGAILRVWDADLRRHLAMKVMLGRGAARPAGDTPALDPLQLARFLEEAQVTGQLDHPGIVPVHELGLDSEGRAYFTMKLVKGVTLKEVFDELGAHGGEWTQTRVLGLLLRACEALSYAHAKGVIHRDLKPANVMVGRFGEVYVMDWGLAKVLARADSRDIRLRAASEPGTLAVSTQRGERGSGASDSPLYTMDGDVVGTPAYMPPEQARGDLAAMGPHSDVYAVGAMLYHLLAGHMPYVPREVRASNHAVWRWVIEGPPAPLQSEAPDAPSELVAICERAMSRDPRARYPDMSALADDLSAYVEGRVVRAYETGAWAEARKWIRRNRALAAALAAAALAVLLGSAGFALKAREATLAAERAEENERLARAETAKVLRLSDVKLLQELERDASELWPVHPVNVPALEAWIERARALLATRARHDATLQEMRARARPWTAEERERDRSQHPGATEVQALEAELDVRSAELEQGLEEGAAEAVRARIAELEARIVDLTAQVESRRTWRLDSTEEQWQHDLLAELVADLEALEAGLLAEDLAAPAIGWSLPKRRARARELQAAFDAEGELAQSWHDALPAIRAAYPGLDLGPQMGLAPLGADADSGLWEFWHVLSGERPLRRADGAGWAIEPETGAVLVLIPAGEFLMGAQASDPQASNYDPQATRFEGPVHECAVEPFFLAKYELTQAQWLRLTGHNPSQYKPGAAVGRSDVSTLSTHPVERVDWNTATATLARFGLALPSEAQWEYAARAGTSTPWWTGADKESLLGAANLADRAATRAGATWQDIADWPELDDGFPVHAPVDGFRPNAFGLVHVAGNVQELCSDDWRSSYAGLDGPPSARALVDASFATYRGGNFGNKAANARSAFRGSTPKDSGDFTCGLRPVRRLD